MRYLSRAANGTLCFAYDGSLYTLRDGSQPTKLNITITADEGNDSLYRQVRMSGATEIALSPKNKEIAFVLHGDVYVTSLDYKTTRQITDTPEQERNINFSPDGRSLVYASERGGLWQIYQTSIAKKDEKQFTYATDLKEEQLVKSDSVCMQPAYSPDGKSVAYIENRGTLKAIDVKTKAVRKASWTAVTNTATPTATCGSSGAPTAGGCCPTTSAMAVGTTATSHSSRLTAVRRLPISPTAATTTATAVG